MTDDAAEGIPLPANESLHRRQRREVLSCDILCGPAVSRFRAGFQRSAHYLRLSPSDFRWIDIPKESDYGVVEIGHCRGRAADSNDYPRAPGKARPYGR